MVRTAAKCRRIAPAARPKVLLMDIRALTQTYAVSPQVAPEDFATIRAAGFVTVINNRPDAEIPAHLHTDPMRQAAEAAGLTYIVNPVIGGAITEDNVATQRQTIEQSPGPVFAYCASGNRSSVVWALAHAGRVPADDLIGTAARFGYSLEWLRPALEHDGA
jgi:uncharacterized protein (TIGR01244 family)